MLNQHPFNLNRDAVIIRLNATLTFYLQVYKYYIISYTNTSIDTILQHTLNVYIVLALHSLYKIRP